ncbi:ABC transporter substrate-binding protein [Sneathiella sp. CAU 1612]|uniref:ABC transporter substrate-binding protein n=1 Tax=Sneathiella sedimenti TaxID=2816034 RepID=A0ABS3F4J7_9PROT|nr:ABC transporter substrate-binding protein [Sneathiella sedimenti]MBO0333272.1 ABC transporter substrate-binding protein [Sneathiella sedimenti]
MIRIIVFLCLFISTAAHADAPKRIVSIGGALTETIYALDAGDLVVGSDTTSYYPPAAASAPKVGYMRALSAEGILSLSPDLVILSEESGPPTVLEQLKSAGVTMLVLEAGRTIGDVKKNIKILAETLEKQGEGESLISEIDGTVSKLQEAIAAQESSKSVMFILQHSGGAPMVAGSKTAADSIIKLAGAENAVTGYDGYKPLSPEAATSLAPDILLVTTQGLEQSGGEAALLAAPGVSLTPAAKNGHVVAMDALLLLGFGPRTAEAALELNGRLNSQ